MLNNLQMSEAGLQNKAVCIYMLIDLPALEWGYRWWRTKQRCCWKKNVMCYRGPEHFKKSYVQLLWALCRDTNKRKQTPHRMAWVEKDHNDHRVSTPLLRAGLPTTRPGCPEPHLTWPWILPRMGPLNHLVWKRPIRTRNPTINKHYHIHH